MNDKSLLDSSESKLEIFDFSFSLSADPNPFLGYPPLSMIS